MATQHDAHSTSEAAKLSTFTGVFTPSVLTILGIILFRRMGYLVGSGGLSQVLIMVMLANIISVLTSVSLSAIATNLKVKGGGDYYLISRTLGLEFGGAIGIVLFGAQSLSIAFYCIGFGEVMAELVPFSHKLLPQLIAAASVALLFIFAWLGSNWATRFQFVVMAVLIASLISFFVGGVFQWDIVTFKTNWLPSANTPPFWMLFAIFFPAATGFTQGVSMSGDLKDPAKNLPAGTFTAVAVSIIVYVAAAIVFAGTLSSESLTRDYNAMSRVAAMDSLVWAGVMAATLSSAMASFMGAPRILQSLASDRIFPFLLFFANGDGPSLNPRRGILLSGAIALVTIALGSLNLIAPVVSMFFLISYGLLNYATYYEAMAASPSFRPTFKFYDARLSLAGGLICLGAMLAIDLTAGIIAITLLFGIYQYLKRTAGPARWADSQCSHHLHEIRQHMLAISDIPEHPRDWRPMILILSDSSRRRKPLLIFADWLQGDSGFASAMRLIEGEGARFRKIRDDAEIELQQDIKDVKVAAYAKAVTVPDINTGIHTVVQAYGMGPIQSNTILLNWLENAPDNAENIRMAAYSRYLSNVFRLKRHIVLLNTSQDDWNHLISLPKDKHRIDVWWQGDATSRLLLLFAHIICENSTWRHAKIRVLDVGADAVSSGKTVADLGQTLSELRISAEPEIVASVDSDTIAAYSKDAALVLIPFRLRNFQVLDFLGNPLSDLFSRLSTSAAMLAARDIDLSAAPEEGKAAEQAAAKDAWIDAYRKAQKAETTAEEASEIMEKKLDEFRRAIADSADESLISRLHNDLSSAKNEAVKAARKAAKASVKADDLEKSAEELGVQLEDLDAKSPKK
ncbi:MAG: amino acid permease [Deltaproteobacteria bacterium]|nr:amino acid permease [Deltaproteobacteria bacterium]